MKYLLDTHTFIWFLEGSDRLPNKLVDIIRDLDNDCYVSLASLWELSIKISASKLELQTEFTELENSMAILSLKTLPVNFSHINQVFTLEFHHRDPFDRMIIAQALTEDLTVISKDKNFSLYPIKLLW
jgi:PIN domain nuclease of toxin-antitoxin system